MAKAKWWLLGITGIFLCLLLGIFIGRNLIDAYILLDNSPQATRPAFNQEEQNDGKININTASLEQLQLLPGVGQTIARRIIEYREKHVRFSSITELLDVEGIGDIKYKELEPYVKVGG